MIQRTLSTKLSILAQQFPVVAVLGPRQSGKTTLARATFPHWVYVSLENPDTRQFASDDPRGFLNTYQPPVIFDEIQRVPNLLSYIQTAVDEINQPGQYILTGSQNFLLQEQLSQSLAGRVALLTLLPLSLEELNPSLSAWSLEERLFTGGYPRIYDQHISPTDWYPNYIHTYLERDVRIMKNIQDLAMFQKFIKLCAGRVGQLLNLSSLALDCGMSHNTVRSWIGILEAIYVIYLLKPHYNNFNKRLLKMPKLYFYDTGLAASLLEIRDAAQFRTHYLFGGLFESFVISEILKYQMHRGRSENIFFWRDKAGHEVDCLLDIPPKLIPFEFKGGKTVLQESFSGLDYWSRLAGVSPEHRYLIYGGEETQKRSIGTFVSWKDIAKTLDTF